MSPVVYSATRARTSLAAHTGEPLPAVGDGFARTDVTSAPLTLTPEP